MNRKERAINLGLKIKSLKGNLSVANSVIKDLKEEIKTALIDEEDKVRLINLYDEVVNELKNAISPSSEKRVELNQEVEDINKKVAHSKDYSHLVKLEGPIIALADKIEATKELKKEHRAALRHRIKNIQDRYNTRIGFMLKKNYDNLKKDITRESRLDNPFKVSMVVKKYNDIVKKTPLFNDDRHDLQAMLDTLWQKSSKDIKDIKENSEL